MTKRIRARKTQSAVGYIRRSTDRQEQSLGDQQRVIDVYALEAGYEVVVVDNLSNSKSDSLSRIEELTGRNMQFHLADLRDTVALKDLFDDEKIDAVIHFAGLKAVRRDLWILFLVALLARGAALAWFLTRSVPLSLDSVDYLACARALLGTAGELEEVKE